MRLYRFSTTDGKHYAIPRFEIQTDHSGAVAPSDFQLSASGNAWDPHGDSDAPADAFTIPVQFEIFDPDPFEVQRQLDYITSARGKIGKLYGAIIHQDNRDRDLWTITSTTHYADKIAADEANTSLSEEDKLNFERFDNTLEWRTINARCISVNHTRSLRNYIFHLVVMTFEVESLPWQSETPNMVHMDRWFWHGAKRWYNTRWGESFFWDLSDNSSTMLHGSREIARGPLEFPHKHDGRVAERDQWRCINRGNAPVTNPVITVYLDRTPVENIEIEGHNSHLVYRGRLEGNTALVIDCGAMTVTSGGVNAFESFRLGTKHKSAYWFEIVPGENEIWIKFGTAPNGNSRLHVDFNHGWS